MSEIYSRAQMDSIQSAAGIENADLNERGRLKLMKALTAGKPGATAKAKKYIAKKRAKHSMHADEYQMTGSPRAHRKAEKNLDKARFMENDLAGRQKQKELAALRAEKRAQNTPERQDFGRFLREDRKRPSGRSKRR